jgi:cell division protein FtsL
VSGPVRRPARPSEQPAQAERGLAVGALELGRGLFGHRALDRLIRGRVWIALIAFALIGIVTLQLLILQLNASIGRSLVREGQLQRSNAALSIQDSELASGERVESEAERLGMELVPESSLRFLGSNPHADVARAAAALGTPVHTSSSASGEVGTASTSSSSSSSSGATGASGEQAATTPQSGEAQPGSTGEAASTAASTGTPSAASSTPTGSAGTPGTESTAGTSAGTSAGAAATPTEQAPAGGSGALTAAGGTQSSGAG